MSDVPDLMMCPKLQLRHYVQSAPPGTSIRPDIMKVLRDDSIPDSAVCIVTRNEVQVEVADGTGIEPVTTGLTDPRSTD